ncbi:serine/threonine-protein kinase [Pseudomarimonas salicorniae]|uniref:Serine/threonine-protein kinase n=1 Tax=Pseudomarimonas salicorniae TaxID=2933270 RepID=A0ABT0GCB5_9GAMM|nr:serine/threonine-protein kinase [Lysobacter sp. CAU 1642]MCK7592177.1 serine/threonine-protein kinase [Lysobacter sp. CAU 1642]
MSEDRELLRIYQAALALPDDARRGYVERETGADSAMKERVFRLLAAAELAQEAGFLERPVSGSVMALGAPVGRSGETTGHPAVIDRYRLIEPLGEGGFGTVYLAEQLEPVRRHVALKLIRSDHIDASFVRRFEAERQVLALLQHPGIAQILDAGATESGDPYLVMERIDGEPITDYCDRRRLTLRARIELFTTLCAALQHAHQKGVIHRDIKPANVLVTEQDGRAIPKIIDFGIARAADLRVNEQTLKTEGGLIGSPMYMSPEQIDPSATLDIDTRADVYSLGVLLYELLVGTTPFAGEGGPLLPMLRQIAETDPPRPSLRAAGLSEELAGKRQTSMQALVRALRGDLDWILLKTLEKDRERRYESPSALAADLQRALAHQPVEARPPSAGYRMSRFVARHRVGVAVTALLILSLIVGLVGTSVGFMHARDEAQRAQQTLMLLNEFLSAPAPEREGKDLTVVGLLERFEPRIDSLSDQPRIQADLLRTYAATYLALGLFDRAAEFAERNLARREALHGDAGLPTLAAVHLLGRIHNEQGRYADAVALQRRAHRHAIARLGEEAVPTIDYAVGLAEALAKSGEREEAAALLADALERRRRLLGDDHDATLHAMNQLGETLFALDRRDEALALAREAVERRSRHFGSDHPETLHALSNLAFQLGETGRYEEAAEMDRDLLERRIRVLGETHRKTVVSMINLAWVLGRLARYEESTELNRRALAILERTQGMEAPDTLVTKANLAMDLLRQGDAGTAEKMLREVVEARSRVLGPDHPVTLVGIGHLAHVLEQQQRYAEALGMVRDLVQRRTAVHGSEHHNTLVARNQLSGLLSKTGAFAEAESWARDALAPRIRLSGPEAAQTLAVRSNLAEALAGQGRLDEAEAIAREVLAIRTRTQGEDHSGTLAAVEAVAEILALRGQLAEARDMFKYALQKRTLRQGAEHPQTRSTRQRLSTLEGSGTD